MSCLEALVTAGWLALVATKKGGLVWPNAKAIWRSPGGGGFCGHEPAPPSNELLRSLRNAPASEGEPKAVLLPMHFRRLSLHFAFLARSSEISPIGIAAG